MGMHLAHALGSLRPKLKWDPALHIAVQSTLYKAFGIVGPILEFGALIAVSLLAWKLRAKRGAFRAHARLGVRARGLRCSPGRCSCCRRTAR